MRLPCKVKTIIKISSTVRTACRKDEFYKLFNNEFGAFDGGCLQIAAALYKIFPSAKPKALTGYRLYSEKRIGQHHTLLQLSPNLFLDGAGISTKVNLINNWKETEGLKVTAIENLDMAHMIRCGVPFNPFIVEKLTDYFIQELKLCLQEI